MADADTQDEFVKSYSDGYFGLKHEGKVLPCRLASRENSKRGALVLRYLADKEGKELSRELDWVQSRDALLRAYPDLGCIKVGPTVGYLSVRPLRQYKKGYVADNINMHIPNSQQIRRAFPRFFVASSSKEVVWQVFNREYWELKMALGLMDDGEGVGYPLSKTFGIYLHSDHPHPLILCRNHDAGVCRDGKVEFFKGYDIYKEQFLRETGVEANVCK